MTPLAQLLAEGTALAGPGGQRLDAAALAAGGPAGALGPGAKVALRLHDPVTLVAALAALDGQVAGVLLLSHALPAETAQALAEKAGCEVIVTDMGDIAGALAPGAALGGARRAEPVETRWLMTTSGTTGLPKIVPHSLRSLARSVYRFRSGEAPVWGLLYDPTRFAGLQVVLQALIGGGTLVAADTSAPLGDQVAALAAAGCTHLSATPTLWRRILMVPDRQGLALKQITLGGEIVDQGTLDALRAAFPDARISHIYASTEAGVGFSVTDGLAGFPAAYLDRAPGNVRMRIDDGILWLKPPVSALAPGTAGIEVDAGGYVRSGDQVEVTGDRIRFLGRENGMINIGGVKVYPETVEAVIAAVPGVALVQVGAKRSPVMGQLVTAAVQPGPGADPDTLRAAIQAACRDNLPREAVPARIAFVDGFQTNAAGKLVRTGG